MRKCLAISLCVFAFTSSAFASTISGTISSYSVREGGHTLVQLNNASTAVCARGGGGFYISSRIAGYKALLATLINAKNNDDRVTIVGKGTCTWGKNEDVLWITTQ